MFVGAVLPLVPTVASSVGVWWLVCWLFAGYSVSMVGMLVVFHRDSVKLLLSQNFQWWKAMSYTRDMGLSLIARLAPLPLLAGSALIGPTLPAVIWGMQPMVWTFVLNSSNSRWSCSSKAWRAFILGFFGCVFAVLAQPADIRGDGLLLATGCLLAVAATVTDGFGSANLAWGDRAARRLPQLAPDDMALTAALCVNLPSTFIAFTVALTLALVTHNPMGDITPALATFAFGIPWASATYAWRKCGMISSNTGVFVIGSAAPAVTTLYAAALGLLSGINLGWLVAGVVMVSVASIVGATDAHPRKEPPIWLHKPWKHQATS